MTTKRWIRIAAIGTALALPVAACGSSDSTEASGDADEFQSPIAEYLGEDTGFFDFDEGDAEAQQIKINEKVKTCMAAEGFEWVPDPEEGAFFFDDEAEDGLDRDSKEWAEKYGFGISTQMFSQDQVGPDLVGHAYDTFGGADDEYVDPNGEYLDGLPEADRVAFDTALYGDYSAMDDIDYESMTDEEIAAAQEELFANFEPTGCMNEVQEELFGGLGYYERFGDELETMYEDIVNDSRVVEFEDKIKTCAEEKGVTYGGVEEVYETFGSRVEGMADELYGAFEETMTTEVIADEDAEFPEFEEPELTDAMKAELAVIQADEIKTAVAVYECGGGDTAMMEVFEEVRIEYEERFVEQNKAALDTYLAEQE